MTRLLPVFRSSSSAAYSDSSPGAHSHFFHFWPVGPEMPWSGSAPTPTLRACLSRSLPLRLRNRGRGNPCFTRAFFQSGRVLSQLQRALIRGEDTSMPRSCPPLRPDRVGWHGRRVRTRLRLILERVFWFVNGGMSQMGVGVEGDGGYVRFHAPRLGSGLRRKDGLEGCGGWWVGWGLCMNGLDSSASLGMTF